MSCLEDDNQVVYCEHCLSLKIRILNDEVDYCDECGSTDIKVGEFDKWEEEYKAKYGKYYIDKQ